MERRGNGVLQWCLPTLQYSDPISGYSSTPFIFF